jgi:hypothetical protein
MRLGTLNFSSAWVLTPWERHTLVWQVFRMARSTVRLCVPNGWERHTLVWHVCS